MVKQTAGRDALTGFADDFARYNDDVLFGEVWNNPNISLHNRSMITISCLVGKGIVDDSLKVHLEKQKILLNDAYITNFHSFCSDLFFSSRFFTLIINI